MAAAAAALISDFHRLIPSIKIWPWWWSDGQRARLLLRQPAQVFNFYCLKIDWKGQKYKNRGRKMSIENKNVLQNWFQAAEERDECI